ncbi:hypothetical protein Pcinc_006369 [Petrolisthes cinctipes]|uniref:Uncharacterized protein n=1 Tax=Petrolisthes cinctipes TaxID=88211 RepID=A0AAE1GD70_PETCI|nr:hypothetical protein Pcinc_006369 [Petrolisthes cinctipes]
MMLILTDIHPVLCCDVTDGWVGLLTPECEGGTTTATTTPAADGGTQGGGRVEGGLPHVQCCKCGCGRPCTLCHPPSPFKFMRSGGDDDDHDDDYDDDHTHGRPRVREHNRRRQRGRRP